MRKSLTIYDAWFIALLCLKISVKPDLSWWCVAAPYLGFVMEALAYAFLSRRWIKVKGWLVFQGIKVDNYLKYKRAARIARRCYNRANQNKFKI